MDICLDTNVFSGDGVFFKWLAENDINSFLPSIAYMELSYHFLKKKKSIENLNSLLDGLNIKIVPFDMEQAYLASINALHHYDLSRHAMDYAIGSYAYKRDIPLVTYNKKHFPWLKEVYTPLEVMEKL